MTPVGAKLESISSFHGVVHAGDSRRRRGVAPIGDSLKVGWGEIIVADRLLAKSGMIVDGVSDLVASEWMREKKAEEEEPIDLTISVFVQKRSLSPFPLVFSIPPFSWFLISSPLCYPSIPVILDSPISLSLSLSEHGTWWRPMREPPSSSLGSDWRLVPNYRIADRPDSGVPLESRLANYYFKRLGSLESTTLPHSLEAATNYMVSLDFNA